MIEENKFIKLSKRIIVHNNYDTNVACCIEEMSELIKVLCKEQRKSKKFSMENLKEEISHVILMCSVIAIENNITNEDLYNIQINAVERMEN